MTRFYTARVLLVTLVTSAVVVAPLVSPGYTSATSPAFEVGSSVETFPTPRPPAPARTLEDQAYPGGVRSTHDPVFIEPLTARTRHARVGLSGWTAPAVPFDIRDAAGGVAFGLTVTWPATGRDATPRDSGR